MIELNCQNFESKLADQVPQGESRIFTPAKWHNAVISETASVRLNDLIESDFIFIPIDSDCFSFVVLADVADAMLIELDRFISLR